ncbi:rho guanine nucleotide exchange factor, partial [Pimephales promelas]
PFPLVSSSRWLKKSGELAAYTDDLSIFRKAFGYKSFYLFLFNDVLIVTKKK